MLFISVLGMIGIEMTSFIAVLGAAGLAVGGGAAFLMDYVNTFFRKPDEIESLYEIPVLAAIPTILKPKQVMLRKLNDIGSIAFAVLTMACFAAFAFVCI